jgi:citrate synthase
VPRNEPLTPPEVAPALKERPFRDRVGASEVERITPGDESFVHRKRYPDVGFHSGLAHQANASPVDELPVVLAIGRMSGWPDHRNEIIHDKDQMIARPRQVRLGHRNRSFVPFEKRG